MTEPEKTFEEVLDEHPVSIQIDGQWQTFPKMCIRDSLERVLVIDDRDTPLTLADERIARAIRENSRICLLYTSASAHRYGVSHLPCRTQRTV